MDPTDGGGGVEAGHIVSLETHFFCLVIRVTLFLFVSNSHCLAPLTQTHFLQPHSAHLCLNISGFVSQSRLNNRNSANQSISLILHEHISFNSDTSPQILLARKYRMYGADWGKLNHWVC